MDTPPAVPGSVAVDGLALQRLIGTTASPAPWQEWGLFIGHRSRLTVGADLAGIKKPPVTGAGGGQPQKARREQRKAPSLVKSAHILRASSRDKTQQPVSSPLGWLRLTLETS